MFNSPEFITAWIDWKKHKAEKHGSPYTATSEERALRVLWHKSHGRESLAIDSIDFSIESNYSNIYPRFKNNFNGSGQNNSGTSTGRGNLSSTAIIESNRTFDTSL